MQLVISLNVSLLLPCSAHPFFEISTLSIYTCMVFLLSKTYKQKGNGLQRIVPMNIILAYLIYLSSFFQTLWFLIPDNPFGEWRSQYEMDYRDASLNFNVFRRQHKKVLMNRQYVAGLRWSSASRQSV